jgi:putative nucleotidyltransferase with HDIG domain
VLLTALLSLILVVYLRRYEPGIFFEPRKIIALSIAILLILVLGNFVIAWGHAMKIDRPGFLIPAALVSIVVAILANVQLAIIVTCVIGIFIAMLAGVNLVGSLQYFLVILGGGIAAAISASRARHRRHLMIAGIYVSGVNAITILGLGLLENMPFAKLGTNCLIGAINGTVVALLTPGLLPIFEYLSRTTTDMELLELADLNQPLLAQLEEKASGSYYHSLHVAQLAKAAAEAMGRDRANPLLTMVGSYYHDIGKTTKPEAFIENQKGENVHDTLNPSMSARVIANHVKDGVRLAKEHKLPQVLIDIIQQHHGTTLIGGRRFYQKAMEADRHNTVRIEDYRYPGPRPQTNEATIILLADSVESARHVVLNGSPSYNRLVRFVREIVESKIMDFQLDECDLTLRDINLITDAFVRVLSGMYHTRIEYPEKIEIAPVIARSSTAREQNGGEDR